MKIKTFKNVMLISILSAIALCGCTIKVSNPSKNEADLAEVGEEICNPVPEGEYREGYVLIKEEKFDKSQLGFAFIKKVTPLYEGSDWYEVELVDGKDTIEAVKELKETKLFEKVDFDYVMGNDAEVESVDVSGNPWSGDEEYIENQGIKEAWKYLKKQGKNPGGSPDVVVAIIDTGVDYNHIDLRDNVWVNTGEIPNNGIDDDGNGYIDDYYGWNSVGHNNNPMDDNGHGTHVAGIVAAADNSFGTVGVAFNCKVMCLKAGNSSGYFNNSDIAEAIRYAYMNGASVINMSFGGSYISDAVKEALEDAYNKCVLVASAGNDSLCNNLKHSLLHPVGVTYPAALPYVIGVMSTSNGGDCVSSFSNYDDTPYDTVEYETYASGEQIPSCWPNNKVAKMSGTSMAAPIISGTAALLRSELTDRDVYSNKYIQSQLINTGTKHPFNNILEEYDMYHSYANVYEAITNIPKPSVSFYDSYIFDNVEYSPNNNGNGVAEAGETIRVGIELKNRGGVAKNVVATIDTIRNDDPSLTDPYFTFNVDRIEMSDIGTYSVRDCGKIYDDSKNVIGTEKYFEIVISKDCPNDYLTKFNINVNYNNGLDKDDKTNYVNKDIYEINISNGYILPSVINEDTVFTNDKKYIVAENVIIPLGVTVTFEEGCDIQFYANSSSYYNSMIISSPQIIVYGRLELIGSNDNHINVFSSDSFIHYVCSFVKNGGVIDFTFVDGVNIYGDFDTLRNCTFKDELSPGYGLPSVYAFDLGKSDKIFNCGSATHFSAERLIDSVLEAKSYGVNYHFITVENSFLDVDANNYVNLIILNAKKCIVLTSQYSDNTYNYNIVLSNVIDCAILSTNDENPYNCSILSLPRSNQGLYLSDGYRRYASNYIRDYIDSSGNPTIDVYAETTDFSLLFPFVRSVKLYDKNDNEVTKVGSEQFKLEIKFSRDMDTSINPKVYFGTVAPFADYQITGEYIDASTWVGTYTVKSLIENGTQTISVKNAYAKNDDILKPLVERSVFTFDIDTTASLSMSMNANATTSGIELSWLQDDYDTLMGYNVYRSTSKDGNFVKINPSVIPGGEESFKDDNAEPGVTYWYTFTVVFSDMSESSPAGKITCTAIDTINPTVYHTPVNQGYLSSNLVISCTASDNIAIGNVKLFYRTIGEESYKCIDMSKQNSRYSATIFGSELSLEGLEYYIVATDATGNSVSKGSADNPYNVIIKEASSISQLGDVDGDGVITSKDALMIMQAINGDLIMTDDQFIRADLNKDGLLSSVEALRILQYINGNVTTLAM